MPTSPDDALKKAARAVADGSPVDWARLSASHPHLRSRLEKLRLIESLAASVRPAADPHDRTVHVDDENGFAWGPLRAIEKIGAGSFGEVYRAFDPVLQREVALKLHRMSGDPAHSEFTPHIEEARKLARVRHPNVLTVHGVEVHDGRAGMWTDFIRGETLEERLAKSGPLGLEEIATIARILCGAVAAVHAAQIVHGDIKASNVMREGDGRIILMDFGAGSYIEQAASGPYALTDRGKSTDSGEGPRLIGTPLVMAPELYDGSEPDERSDLYALGVLLFRLATGRHPIEATTGEELVRRHKEPRVPLWELRPDLPESFARAIERALAPDPGARYAGATEMESVLAASLGSRPEPTGAREAGAVRNPLHFPTRFIGRDRELAELRRIVIESGMVSLVGPGGTGKTRLAARLADEMSGGFPGGVCIVELAALTHDSPLEAEIARALGACEEPSRPVSETLVEFLAGNRRLLILDNCEQVLAETRAFCDSIRQSCPDLHMIATSRQALGTIGERVYVVPPMGLPAQARGAAGNGLEIADAESVRLFIDRAVRSRPEFSLNESNAPHVAAICRRLEGIPLAIELAAARVRALSTDALASRLEESFRILTGGDGGSSRHSTLEASIEWSVRLLTGPEGRLFRRLGVFAGPWSIEAAEAVCGDDAAGHGEIDGEPILDLMGGLVEKSLVTFEVPGEDRGDAGAGSAPGRSSYRMQEMVRQFAGAALQRSGEADALRSRHLTFYQRYTEEIRMRIYGSEQEVLLPWVEAQQDNYRAAIRWSMTEHGDIDAGLRIAAIIRRLWFVRGYITEGRRLLQDLIDTGRGEPRHRANAIVSAASLAWSVGDVATSERLALEALRIQEESGTPEGPIPALAMLGTIASDTGDYDKARNLMERALELRRPTGDKTSLAAILCNLGVLCARSGDLASAARYYEEAYPLMVEQGDLPGAATVMQNLSATARSHGDMARSKELAIESVRILRSTTNRRGLSGAMVNLAMVYKEEGDFAKTRELLIESLVGARDLDDRADVLNVLESLAQLWTEDGQFDRAARLFGAAASLREVLRLTVHRLALEDHETALGRIRESLGADRFAAETAMGRAMDMERATAFAIDPTRPWRTTE